MKQISLIAAVDERGGLGRNNQLLCHLPADLKYFKSTTMGKPIIMGRNTFESIGKALPGRVNIVLSKTKAEIEGVSIVTTIEEALALVEDASEVMIIGGASIYQQTMPMAGRIYLTQIHHTFDADVFFPEIDSAVWRCISREFRTKDEANPYDMTFLCYERDI